jgi:hypothetical protein
MKKAFNVIFSVTDIFTIIFAAYYYLVPVLWIIPNDIFLKLYYQSTLSKIFCSSYAVVYILMMTVLNTVRAAFMLSRRTVIMMCVTWGIVFSAILLAAFFI